MWVVVEVQDSIVEHSLVTTVSSVFCHPTPAETRGERNQIF